MIKAVYQNGVIHPTEPIPDEWVDGQELEIVALPTRDESNLDALDEWYRDLERLAAEIDDDEWEQMDTAIREADRLQKEGMRRAMNIEYPTRNE